MQFGRGLLIGNLCTVPVGRDEANPTGRDLSIFDAVLTRCWRCPPRPYQIAPGLQNPTKQQPERSGGNRSRKETVEELSIDSTHPLRPDASSDDHADDADDHHPGVL